MILRLVTVLEQRKMIRTRTSDFRIPRSDALPLSHIVFTVIKVYYEVYITRVLHIARISNVVASCFVNRIIKMSSKLTISLILSFIG